MNPSKGLLVVSFGTSYLQVQEKTINQIEQDLRETFPERVFYRAWTSDIIRKILLQRDQIPIYSVSEALEQMAAAGIEDLLVQPTHILTGNKNDLMRQQINSYSHRFKSLRIGDPLLCSTSDYLATIAALGQEYAGESDTAVVLIGHSTKHYANSTYAALDYMLKERGYPQFFVGTVEGYPNFEIVFNLLQKSPYRKIVLAPLMIVAGEHVNKDMAGEQENSWENRLKQAGFEVQSVLKGLGEIPAIREILVKHAQNKEL